VIINTERLRRVGLPLVAAVCAVVPLAANEVSFHPEIVVAAGWTDNVLFAPSGREKSDNFSRAVAILPVRKRLETGYARFMYAPGLERYADESQLDLDRHRAACHVETMPTSRSSFVWHADFEKSQTEGAPPLAAPDNLFVTPRIVRRRLRTRLLYGREAARRWNWSTGIIAADYGFSGAGDASDGFASSSLENRAELHGLAGAYWDRSRGEQLGVEIGHSIYDLDSGGREDGGQLTLAWSRDVGEDRYMEFRIGGFWRDFDSSGTSSDESQAGSDSGIQGRFVLTKQAKHVDLGLLLSRGTSPGGPLSSTATDSIAQLTLSGYSARLWAWVIMGRYADRESTRSVEPDVSSLSGSGRLEWLPSRRVGVRMDLSHVDQSSDEAEYDISATSLVLGLVWYPRGPSETQRTSGENRSLTRTLVQL
jgi:hypothetical protein